MGSGSVAVPCDVPSEWTLSARILTTPRLTQSEPDRRCMSCVCESLKS